MATNGKKGQKLAKAALAKNNVLRVDIAGDYEDDRQKFRNLYNDFGIVYSGNNVATNPVTDDIDTLQLAAHTHSNKSLLDDTTASYTTTAETKLAGIAVGANNYVHPATHIIAEVEGLQAIVDDYEARIAALEATLADYAAHTHNYEDNDGTADTTRTSAGVN